MLASTLPGTRDTLLCPSSQPGIDGARVLGVVQQTADGREIASAIVEHSLMFPRPGWVELSAEATWTDAQDIIRNAGRARYGGSVSSGRGFPPGGAVPDKSMPALRWRQLPLGDAYRADTARGRRSVAAVPHPPRMPVVPPGGCRRVPAVPRDRNGKLPCVGGHAKRDPAPPGAYLGVASWRRQSHPPPQRGE